MKIKYLVIVLLFGGLAFYGFFNNNKLKNEGQEIDAYAIEESGYRTGRFVRDWKFLYIFEDKPYYCFIPDTEKNMEFSNLYKLKINPSNPSRHLNIKSLKNKIKNTVIFYGFGFEKDCQVEIKSDNKLIIAKTKIDIDFAKELKLKSNYEVLIHRGKEIFAKYHFNFASPSNKTFFPIELTPSQSKVKKTITFDSNGYYTLSVTE